MARGPRDPILTAADQICRLIEQVDDVRTLAFYHAVGHVVQSVPERYGRMIKLARALKERQKSGVDRGTLRKCWAFSQQLTLAQVKILQNHQVSWRAAARLAKKELSGRVRSKLIRDIRTSQLHTKELGAEITKRSGKQSFVTSHSLITAGRRANTAVDALVDIHRHAASRDLKDKARAIIRKLRKRTTRMR
ncbi:MAG: hypothetical protein K8T91_03825 [Planctomycetes bacterium]|nr:hypothetical protein [Planctomycetota bacterium]